MIIEQKGVYGHIIARDEAPNFFRETEYKANNQHRLDGHQIRKQSWRKRGYIHSSEFILRCKRMNPGLIVQQQLNFPNEWGFYLDVKGKLTYVSGFRKGWISEYSYTLTDEKDLENEEVRGWRTALVRLLGWGAVTWHQVMREFRDCPGNGGEKWRKDTRKWRNGRSERVSARNLRNKLIR